MNSTKQARPKIQVKTEVVQRYICPETGTTFDTEEGARRSAARAIRERQGKLRISEDPATRLAQQDWIRLNLENLEDLPRLIMEKAKEFWGFKCEVSFPQGLRFGGVSYSTPPIGEARETFPGRSGYREYLGWRGQICGKALSHKKLVGINSIADVLCDRGYNSTGYGFRGLHTTSGCPGGRVTDMDIGFIMYLQDFPLLQKKYELYQEEEEKLRQQQAARLQLETEAARAVNDSPEHQALHKEVKKMQEKLGRLTYNIMAKYRDDHPVHPIPIHHTYPKLKEMFNEYNSCGTIDDRQWYYDANDQH